MCMRVSKTLVFPYFWMVGIYVILSSFSVFCFWGGVGTFSISNGLCNMWNNLIIQLVNSF